MYRKWITFSLLLLAASVGTARAQDPTPGTAPDRGHTRGAFGAGVQLTWPAYGLSAMYDLSETLSVQGVVGSAGYGFSLTGRGIYRFTPQEKFTPYAYGSVGTWSGYLGYGMVPNFGAGGGVELDVRTFAPDLPPLFIGVEGGLNLVTYSGGSYTYFEFGPGIHYRF